MCTKYKQLNNYPLKRLGQTKAIDPLPRRASEPCSDFVSFELFVFNTNSVVDSSFHRPKSIFCRSPLRVHNSLLKVSVTMKKCRPHNHHFRCCNSIPRTGRPVSFKKIINFETVDGSDEFLSFHHTVVFSRPISVSCYVRRDPCVRYRSRNKKEIFYHHQKNTAVRLLGLSSGRQNPITYTMCNIKSPQPL